MQPLVLAEARTKEKAKEAPARGKENARSRELAPSRESMASERGTLGSPIDLKTRVVKGPKGIRASHDL